MKRVWIGVFACCVMLTSVAQGAQEKKEDRKDKDEKAEKSSKAAEAELPPDSTTSGSVTVGGQVIAYKAVAGR